jgi:NAD(P)-dependent dehydrogenase (short-subunit alcohol dehydrogenase family)
MKPPYFDMTGKVAIVTGGATGIGRGIAEGLADVGANIVIASRRLEKCEAACEEISKRTGVKTLPHRCDITKRHEIQAFVEDVLNEFGHMDILVNNSGIGGSEKPILEMVEEDWNNTMDTNLKGVFTLSQAVVRKMRERGEGGKVINVASIGGLIGFPNMSAYCASKGGCVQLTKVMALEWARYNIQVNAILPGYFDTPLNREFFSSDIGKQIIKQHIPMKRLAQIEEIKGVAILLASQASNFITGSTIAIDGGHSSW